MDPNNTIVRRQVQSVEFGFYTDEDVRSRSVVEITSPQAIDPNLRTPLPGGLYDTKMGPFDSSNGGVCETCACSFLNCPGHSGHIELCVPVYHPLLFSSMIKLLRCKCLHCHELRAPKQELEQLKTQFGLLNSGRLQEALELEESIRHVSRQARENLDRGTSVSSAVEMAIQELLQGLEQQPSHGTTGEGHADSSSLERQTRSTMQQLLLSSCLQRKKCEHCGAFSPKIRQDASNKVFQAVLSGKQSRINQAERIAITSALEYDKDKAGYDSDDTMEDRQPSKRDSDSDDSDKSTDEEKGDANTPSNDRYMTAFEVQAQVRLTWAKQPLLCAALFGGGPEGFKRFFLFAVPVPPSRFRPLMMLGSLQAEHSQNTYLNKIISLNDRIRSLLVDSESNAYTQWIELQTMVNCFMDSSKDPSATASSNVNPGIRQILEKKEGIFRKHMMGKRVDFACRSVISPDPYVGTNEIGIPLHFAKTLTYPTPVIDLNFVEMRRLVERGTNHHPGASWVRFPDGRRIDLSRMDDKRRESVAARLLANVKKGGPPVIVGRQLRNGDMMLVNRQPTLHKPGIMAHSVRILHDPTQKTIRMHYANCNTYNADFDGDEMNCHFPQNDCASAESKFIAATDLQYIVPTDGSPLRGLIQDHVDAGVKMTGKDTFLEKWEYQQLIFAALASLPGLEVVRADADIELLPPAVLKPMELWTGKQVLSTLLHHLRKGNDREDVGAREEELPGISVERKAKTPEHGFGASHKEHLVIIRNGELLRGVLDKAAFGSTEFSLVHAVYEAYGPGRAGLLLNSLGRLFTAYLQYYSGHSCRMEDLILTKEADTARRKLVNRAYNVGARAAKAWADAEGGKVEIESVKGKEGADTPLKPVESAAASAKIGQLLSGGEGKENFAVLDGYMQSKLNPLASEIIKACLPNGLAVPFPSNTFSLMVTTGAKGSTVNQSQISCALGQQALEGRRVPRLSSGRTLPSFAPYDPNPRADGFIMDRFLTGIRPQEYYFHCMAGREGLVDTAVKTSRSGYLQRCLVKHLEELKVCYDSTVRNGDGGVVQFLYGEDGLDPTKSTYLDCSSPSFEYMARNQKALYRRNLPLPDSSIDVAAKDVERQSVAESGDIQVGAFVKARRLRVGSQWTRGALCKGWYSAEVLKRRKNGSYELKFLRDGCIVSHVPVEVDLGRCGSVKTDALSSVCVLIQPAVPDPALSGAEGLTGSHRIGVSGACVSERVASATASALRSDGRLRNVLKASGVSSKEFGSLISAKYASSLCAPGEAVGSIAAQSVGEPSTQMTLNTFHLAGSGANVTLGIPRLREIIMTASKELKTPTMSVPLRDSVSDKDAIKLTRSFAKLALMELISSHGGVQVREALEQESSGSWQRAYHVTLKLHPAERIREAFGLRLEDIAQVVTESFVPTLANIMKKEMARASTDEDDVAAVHGGMASEFIEDAPTSSSSTGRRSGGDDELEDDDDDVGNGDGEAMGEEDGINASRFGHRQEMTSYGPMDLEDEDVAREPVLMDEQRPDTTNRPDSSDTDNPDDAPHQTPSASSFFGSNMLKIDKAANSFILRPLKVDPSVRPLLMVGLVERAASSTLVRSRPKLHQAFINDEENGRGRSFQTAGVNFEEIWQLDDTMVDANRLASNDIWAIRCAYGVEAGRNNIVDQIRSVFGAYGISVDPRHLSLIADYMTFDGGFSALNRGGMAHVGSPFLQMSFETTATFLTKAANEAQRESLQSPSANIVLGRPIRHGTGAFDVLVPSPK